MNVSPSERPSLSTQLFSVVYTLFEHGLWHNLPLQDAAFAEQPEEDKLTTVTPRNDTDGPLALLVGIFIFLSLFSFSILLTTLFRCYLHHVVAMMLSDV